MKIIPVALAYHACVILCVTLSILSKHMAHDFFKPAMGSKVLVCPD